MLFQRVMTAVIGGSILLLLIYLGGVYALFASIFLLSLSAYEILSIASFKPAEKVISMLSLLGSFYFFYMNAPAYSFFLPLIIFTFVRKNEKQSAFSIYALTIYVAFGFYRFYKLSLPEKTLLPIVILLAAVWSLDTISYFIGSYFGKIKLAPKISPNKTVEGALAGIVAGTIAFTLGVQIANYDTNLLQAIIKGICYSFAAIAGDLIESAYKRAFSVKDSGSILPGHGGVLDRFDSLLAVLVVSSLINF